MENTMQKHRTNLRAYTVGSAISRKRRRTSKTFAQALTLILIGALLGAVVYALTVKHPGQAYRETVHYRETGEF